MSPAQIAEAIARQGSLITSIEGLRGKRRTLRVFDEQIPVDVDGWVPDADYIDPSRPYEATLVPHASRPSARRKLIIGASVLVGLLVVPVTALIAVTVLAFGPILGFF